MKMSIQSCLKSPSTFIVGWFFYRDIAHPLTGKAALIFRAMSSTIAVLELRALIDRNGYFMSGIKVTAGRLSRLALRFFPGVVGPRVFATAFAPVGQECQFNVRNSFGTLSDTTKTVLEKPVVGGIDFFVFSEFGDSHERR